MSFSEQDTIAAIATPPGRGGIGIIRLSGKNSLFIAKELTGIEPEPRYAHFARFHSEQEYIDEGLLLYFPAPNSFTGEEVIELQGHGGPMVQKMLLEACLKSGARLANPGEFSQRAFLNDRMDLTQAEAIADLIDAGTATGVRAANRSLQGVFSSQVNDLQEQLTQIRIFVEAAIDFPEEEIDFIADSDVLQRIDKAQNSLEQLLIEARTGLLIQEGARVAIVGRPNAGKSSLLNALARQDVAIVTDIAGTTRDSIEQHVDLDGVPVTFIDTAGLNESPDQVEQIGIQRSLSKAKDADIILFVYDMAKETSHSPAEILGEFSDVLSTEKPVIYLANKCDLVNKTDVLEGAIAISAKQGKGIQELIEAIQNTLNLNEREPQFTARVRHVDALTNCLKEIATGVEVFNQHQSGELLAEDLRLSQRHLSEITGDLSADDLLGEIFAGFCIGK